MEKTAALTREMIGTEVNVRILGIKGVSKAEVLGFGTCDKWCRLKALEGADKNFCCGDEKSFQVSAVKVIVA
jgi:hypothetical protein